MLQRLTQAFFHRLSNVFVLFGLALVLVGASVQASRQAYLADDDQGAPPSFDASLALITATVRVALPTRATATPPPAAPPDRLVIPRLGLDTPVVTVGWEARVISGEHVGNIWQTASFAAGFHQGSAPPGQAGNTVLSGHNNIEGSIFKQLHDLEPFDWIYVFAGGQRFAYVVEENFIIPEAKASAEQRLANVKWISATPDERLTLISCYPPWSNTYRVIVLARPIHDPADIPFDAPALGPEPTAAAR
jgi:sortase A